MVARALRFASLAWVVAWGLTAPDAPAQQVTATCMLNAAENRVYNLVPLEGTLRSTEQMLDPQLPFMQYLPKGHDPTKKWPVIVFLHGIGEVGGNLRKVTEHSLPRVVESPNWNWPFIVLSPVLPTPSWHPRAQLVSDILDYAVSELGGDPNRLYLTGVSHGGAGTLAIGIELADKIAALWPVCPGGDADDYNWAMRTAIATKPTMFLVGTQDGEYDSSQGWATDLEGSGAPMFSEHLIPTAEEHEDTIPPAILDQSHVFVSYQNLPHDIWHAAYGNFCTVLTSYKTVQYDWLLKQSLDGSTFVDPRDPNAPAGGAGGTGGAPASAGGGAGGAGTGGSGVMMMSGASGAAAGTPSTTPPGGSAGDSSITPPTGSTPATTESGCGCSMPGQQSSAASLWLSSLLGLALCLLVRSRTRSC
jgi:acetyl esterase/lipase